MSRIFTIGEMLIDFIPNEKNISLKDVKTFNKMAGGAPANVAVCASKLGAESYFIGKFSDDAFGEFLIETLEEYKVKTDYIFKTDEAKTALAFVSLKADGDRDFSFYRNPSADMLLSIDEVSDIEFTKDDIISFCSVDLVDYPVRYATEQVLKNIKKAEGLIVFDPNLRLNLWDDHDELYETIKYFAKYTDIIKISEDELEFITRKNDYQEAINFIKSLGVKNIIITKGKNGVQGIFNELIVDIEGIKVEAVDTTGAGDAFVGAVLYKLSKLDKEINIKEEELRDILSFANKVAAIVTTRYGAMASLPSLEEVEQLK